MVGSGTCYEFLLHAWHTTSVHAREVRKVEDGGSDVGMHTRTSSRTSFRSAPE